MKPIQFAIVLSAMLAGASLMNFAVKTGAASSTVDLAEIREQARLGFLDRCALHYVNKNDALKDPANAGAVNRAFVTNCLCLYRAVEESYREKAEVTAQIKFTLETQFLLRAFEDNSLSQKYLQNYRAVMAGLDADEKATVQSLLEGYGAEVVDRATGCAANGDPEDGSR